MRLEKLESATVNPVNVADELLSANYIVSEEVEEDRIALALQLVECLVEQSGDLILVGLRC